MKIKLLVTSVMAGLLAAAVAVLAHGAVGPLINGNQINPNSNIQISSITSTYGVSAGSLTLTGTSGRVILANTNGLIMRNPSNTNDIYSFNPGGGQLLMADLFGNTGNLVTQPASGERSKGIGLFGDNGQGAWVGGGTVPGDKAQIVYYNGTNYKEALSVPAVSGSVSTMTLMTSGGSVGIGTPSPESKLTVFNGDIRISTNSGTHGYYFQDGTALFTAAGAAGITQLTGDVTAGPGTGSQVATIAANAVTNTKIASDSASFAKVSGGVGSISGIVTSFSGGIASGDYYALKGSTIIHMEGASLSVGNSAGTNNTDQSGNSFFGTAAGNANTSGSLNSCFGVNACKAVTTGTGNVYMGFGAGALDNSVGSNVGIGLSAGGNNVSGTGNIFLGYHAGLNETGSNKLYIANGEANPALIFGNFSSGRVGISTQAPVATLDVNGTFNANGAATAASFSGVGSGLTSLTAANISAGSLGANVIASSIAANGVTAGTYGSATQVGQFVVGGDGRLTTATNVTISGVPAATVPASGVQAGTLGASVIASSIAVNSVGTAQIVDAAVDTSKLATDAVTTVKILNSAVDTNKIATDAVTSTKLLSSSASFAKVTGAIGSITGSSTAFTGTVASAGDLTVGNGTNRSTVSASGFVTLANISVPTASRGRIYFDPSGSGSLNVSLDGLSFVSLATGTVGASGNLSGTLTAGKLPKASATNTLTDSIVSENGSSATITSNYGGGLRVLSGGFTPTISTNIISAVNLAGAQYIVGLTTVTGTGTQRDSMFIGYGGDNATNRSRLAVYNSVAQSGLAGAELYFALSSGTLAQPAFFSNNPANGTVLSRYTLNVSTGLGMISMAEIRNVVDSSSGGINTLPGGQLNFPVATAFFTMSSSATTSSEKMRISPNGVLMVNGTTPVFGTTGIDVQGTGVIRTVGGLLVGSTSTFDNGSAMNVMGRAMFGQASVPDNNVEINGNGYQNSNNPWMVFRAAKTNGSPSDFIGRWTAGGFMQTSNSYWEMSNSDWITENSVDPTWMVKIGGTDGPTAGPSFAQGGDRYDIARAPAKSGNITTSEFRPYFSIYTNGTSTATVLIPGGVQANASGNPANAFTVLASTFNIAYNGLVTMPGQPQLRAHLNGSTNAQVAPTGVFTAITYGVDDYKQNIGHDVTNSSATFTIPYAGRYRIHACVNTNSGISIPSATMEIQINGATNATLIDSAAGSAATGGQTYCADDTLDFAAADTFQIRFFHNAATALSIFGNTAYTYITIRME